MTTYLHRFNPPVTRCTEITFGVRYHHAQPTINETVWVVGGDADALYARALDDVRDRHPHAAISLIRIVQCPPLGLPE